jgi:hypothetical protein
MRGQPQAVEDDGVADVKVGSGGRHLGLWTLWRIQGKYMPFPVFRHPPMRCRDAVER